MQDKIESKSEVELEDKFDGEVGDVERLIKWNLKMIVSIIIMALGASYGVIGYKFFEKVFSEPTHGVSGLMLVSFLAGIPIAIGILVGFSATRQNSASLLRPTILPSLSTALFVFAAGAILREGTICIVMAAPIFLILTVIGGIIGVLMSLFGGSHSSKLLSVTLVLPFLSAPIENRLPPVTAYQTTTQSIYIAASPATVWHHINFPTDIQPKELDGGLVYLIGAPHPIEARTIEAKVGGLRKLRWERGVSFDETITAWEPNKHIAWNYHFRPDSFPSGSLDDHIVIGGRYFNMTATSYTLTPVGNGTQLSIEVLTSVTTNFNWYADFCAHILINDTAKTILQFYKHRSELPQIASFNP